MVCVAVLVADYKLTGLPQTDSRYYSTSKKLCLKRYRCTCTDQDAYIT